ncbi:MAG: FxsA family protein [Halieaceae bacterium]|jgi:UPF0716 protein FxsA|nr:FxsA family protein [Halieaceae bacterium]
MRWIFLLLPWVELYSLIKLGGQIGGFPAVLYVFLTLVLGLSIVRLQGMEIIARLREAQQGGVLTERLLADDLAVGLAGVLLMVPGLVTDFLAAAVLVGPIWRRLTGQTRAASPPPGPSAGPDSGASSRASGPQRDPSGAHRGANRGSGRPDTIEGEYRRLDDE